MCSWGTCQVDEAIGQRDRSRLSPDERAFFRAYGYLHLPSYFDDETVAALQREARSALDWVDASPARTAQSTRLVRAGHIPAVYVPMVSHLTPTSRSLAEGAGLLGVAEALVRMRCAPKPPKVVRYHGDTRWHADAPAGIRGVKLAAYLEPLLTGSGSLLITPCSHSPEASALVGKYHDLLNYYHGHPEACTGPPTEPSGLPSVAVESVPGDLIVFDLRLWHASFGGRDRTQWNMSFLGVPDAPEEQRAVRDYLRDTAAIARDDPTGSYPHFPPAWGDTPAPSVAVRRLQELGVVRGRRPP